MPPERYLSSNHQHENNENAHEHHARTHVAFRAGRGFGRRRAGAQFEKRAPALAEQLRIWNSVLAAPAQHPAHRDRPHDESPHGVRQRRPGVILLRTAGMNVFATARPRK